MLWTYRQEQKVAICDKKAVKIRGAECCGLTDRSRRWQSVTRKQLKYEEQNAVDLQTGAEGYNL